MACWYKDKNEFKRNCMGRAAIKNQERIEKYNVYKKRIFFSSRNAAQCQNFALQIIWALHTVPQDSFRFNKNCPKQATELIFIGILYSVYIYAKHTCKHSHNLTK